MAEGLNLPVPLSAKTGVWLYFFVESDGRLTRVEQEETVLDILTLQRQDLKQRAIHMKSDERILGDGDGAQVGCPRSRDLKKGWAGPDLS